MDEFDFYPQKPDLIERESRGSLSSTIFSMVLFVMVFLFVFADSVRFVAMLLIVLVIHELGHYIMMKRFKYKNVRMLFIPLMGAFVSGSKSEYSQKQSFFMIAAGPMPGILIGSMLILFSQSFDSTAMFNFGLIFSVLNLLNLIPLDPLDGGQLFKLLLRKNHELLLLVFAFFSSLVIIALGWFLDSYILIIFGFLMGFRVRSLQKRYQMHKDCIEEEVNFRTTYKKLTNKEFSKIKAIVLQHTPTLAKYIEFADSSEVESLLASQVNSVLVTPTVKDTSLVFRIILVLFWILCFLSPIILFYTIDKTWIEYAVSNW